MIHTCMLYDISMTATKQLNNIYAMFFLNFELILFLINVYSVFVLLIVSISHCRQVALTTVALNKVCFIISKS